MVYSKKVKNILIGGLTVGLLAISAYAFIFKSPETATDLPEVDLATLAPTTTSGAYPTPGATTTPQSGQGTIQGKLCYPSQFLPKGTIEAKNVATKTISTQDYPGSQNGGLSSYSFSLPTGTYILRYRAQVNANSQDFYDGYHTKTCSTGTETSCAATNARIHIELAVKSGEVVKGVDLCDFYYGEQSEPAF